MKTNLYYVAGTNSLVLPQTIYIQKRSRQILCVHESSYLTT